VDRGSQSCATRRRHRGAHRLAAPRAGRDADSRAARGIGRRHRGDRGPDDYVPLLASDSARGRPARSMARRARGRLGVPRSLRLARVPRGRRRPLRSRDRRAAPALGARRGAVYSGVFARDRRLRRAIR
jgi:hypothetical protein